MKRLTAILASFALTAFAALSLAGPASAADETTEMNLEMTPLAGGLFKEAAKPVNWRIETLVKTASPKILPMKQANLKMPAQLSFNPSASMPVCSDEDLNANNVSVTVPEVVDRCPDSILGNGLAKFALAQNSGSILDGVMIIFNGGKVNGLPKIKVYAYSYDTGVGLYTESVLQKNGQLNFEIPPLTADSSVTMLNLNIPGEPTDLFVASKNITVTLPAGQDTKYAQATCPSGSWAWSGQFLLGKRNTAGQDDGLTTTLDNSGTTDCSGSAGKAKFGGLKVKGPASVKAGKKGTYKVTIKNTGTATAKGVKLAVSGKGVKGKANGGKIAPGKSKTVKVKVKFTKKGKVKAAFKVTASKTKAKSAKKSVKVK